MKIITEREKELVVSQYRDGMPLRKIAAYANMSQTTIMKIVHESGTPLRGRKTLYGEAEREDVRRLYDSGMSILDIMSTTGIRSEQTIYRIVGHPKWRKRKDSQ